MTIAPPAASGPTRLTVVLLIVGGVLLATIAVLVTLLLTRGTAVPGTADSPGPLVSDSPSPDAPGEDPPPEDTSPRFTRFTAETEVECDPTGEQEKPEIRFSWTSENAVEAWYTPSDEDAYDDQYMRVPVNGSDDDLTDEHLFPCNHDEFLDVTITLIGPDGEHVSHHVVFRDVNWGG